MARGAARLLAAVAGAADAQGAHPQCLVLPTRCKREGRVRGEGAGSDAMGDESVKANTSTRSSLRIRRLDAQGLAMQLHMAVRAH
eukprot:609909-Pleurochrysis_carterae.AAC.4